MCPASEYGASLKLPRTISEKCPVGTGCGATFTTRELEHALLLMWGRISCNPCTRPSPCHNRRSLTPARTSAFSVRFAPSRAPRLGKFWITGVNSGGAPCPGGSKCSDAGTSFGPGEDGFARFVSGAIIRSWVSLNLAVGTVKRGRDCSPRW